MKGKFRGPGLRPRRSYALGYLGRVVIYYVHIPDPIIKLLVSVIQ